jgi:hypothetical protein
MLFNAASSALLLRETGIRLLLLLLLVGTLVLLGCCAVCSVCCAGCGLSMWCMRVRLASR